MIETLERPVIGQPWQGGIYAGISVHDKQPVYLVLLPSDAEHKSWNAAHKSWKQALAWATKQGGELPSRVDFLILYQNVKSEFKEDWYWTAQTYELGEKYAWCQYFGHGGQHSGAKIHKCRARAVRRIPIQEAA